MIVLGVVYFLIRKTVSDAGSAIANINKGTPYEGSGPIGTLGNIANTVSGGSLTRLGEKVASFFVPSPNDKVFATDYIVTFPNGARHAISSTLVNANGFFTYSGVRYRLALDSNGKKIAVQS